MKSEMPPKNKRTVSKAFQENLNQLSTMVSEATGFGAALSKLEQESGATQHDLKMQENGSVSTSIQHFKDLAQEFLTSFKEELSNFEDKDKAAIQSNDVVNQLMKFLNESTNKDFADVKAFLKKNKIKNLDVLLDKFDQIIKSYSISVRSKNKIGLLRSHKDAVTISSFYEELTKKSKKIDLKIQGLKNVGKTAYAFAGMLLAIASLPGYAVSYGSLGVMKISRAGLKMIASAFMKIAHVIGRLVQIAKSLARGALIASTSVAVGGLNAITSFASPEYYRAHGRENFSAMYEMNNAWVTSFQGILKDIHENDIKTVENRVSDIIQTIKSMEVPSKKDIVDSVFKSLQKFPTITETYNSLRSEANGISEDVQSAYNSTKETLSQGFDSAKNGFSNIMPSMFGKENSRNKIEYSIIDHKDDIDNMPTI